MRSLRNWIAIHTTRMRIFFEGKSDVKEVEETFSKFLVDIERQEQHGFDQLLTLLGYLPVQVQKEGQCITHWRESLFS
jgi:hypothetical protein